LSKKAVNNETLTVNMVSETEFSVKAHGVHTAYLNISNMLRRAGVEVLINSSKKAQLTHIQTIGSYGLFKLLTNKPTVVSAHVVPQSFIGSLIAAKYWYWEAKKYLSFFYNRANLVLAVAPKVRDQLLEIGVKRRIEFFPNPVDEKVFYPSKDFRQQGREKLNIGTEELVILGVGQAQPRKGIVDFINVARDLPHIRFVWVGGQPFKNFTADAEKINHILDSKPANVEIVDNVNYSEMNLVYNAADIFFLPSYQENAPMAVIEAAACGLPVLLRDIDEYKLLYKDNYLAGQNETFGEIINRLTKDRSFFEKSSQEASVLAKKFSFATLGTQLIKLYREIL
jgi:1,2-diacylglycerol-3-alpha-glucose alpha-1,2-galactosyltransferase